jgi:hypothetical protein
MTAEVKYLALVMDKVLTQKAWLSSVGLSGLVGAHLVKLEFNQSGVLDIHHDHQTHIDHWFHSLVAWGYIQGQQGITQ